MILNTSRFYAEFTRDALVRGDLATRTAANVANVNAGIRSVDEVRGQENWNRRGGKADELREPQNITGKAAVTSTQRAMPEPDKDDDQARAIVVEASARLIRKEVKAVQRLAVRHAGDADAFAGAVTEFYAGHAALLQAALLMPAAAAESYCAGQASAVLGAEGLLALEAVVANWDTNTYTAGLAAWALEGEAA